MSVVKIVGGRVAALDCELPRSAEEAREQEVMYYFTGKPCKRGHFSRRRTTTHNCVECCRTVDQQTETYKKNIKSRIYRYKHSDIGVAKTQEWATSDIGRFSNSLGERVKRGGSKVKIAHGLRCRLKKLFKGWKSVSAVRDLGCTVEEAMSYWQSLPTWNSEWTWADQGKLFHMDHIKSLALFDLTDSGQLLIAVHYTNIQPLSIEEHRVKTVLDVNRMRRLGVGRRDVVDPR